MMLAIDELFTHLQRSAFRRRFHLRKKERLYLEKKGIETILSHGNDFVRQRLAEVDPAHDGRQTPMGNHPFFVAQHATATCCRGCLQKWHGIPEGRSLNEKEIDYILKVNAAWLQRQTGDASTHG